MISLTVFFFSKNNEQLNLKKKLIPRFRVPSAFSLINFYCVFKTCEMNARSAYSIYVHKKAHSVQYAENCPVLKVNSLNAIVAII